MKRWRALQQKKYREEYGRFLVQGRKVVAELLASTLEVEAVLATQEEAAFVEPLLRGAPLHVLPQLELDRIGTFEKGNTLIAIAHTPKTPAFRHPAADELMLALDGVRDPRNLGGLLRIADWFGIKRVLLGDCMEPFNPKAVQSTMGSLFRIELREVADLASELTQLKARTYIADMDGAPAFEATLQYPAVLVLGSESHGHSAAVRALGADVISIPRVGQAESLNVAMAASALCMEFLRQRTGRPGP